MAEQDLQAVAFPKLDPGVFTAGDVLELKHSILRMVAAGKGIIQVKTVLLIALLALARKLIILDLRAFSAATLLALAALLLALGVAYWLVRDQDFKHTVH
jgi:uncharacterized membrane protein (DUF373 family)